MKKLAIPFVVGIAIGLGGSTGAALLLGGEPQSLEESLAHAMEGGDSAHVDAEAEHADTTGHATADVAHDSIPVPAGANALVAGDSPEQGPIAENGAPTLALGGGAAGAAAPSGPEPRAMSSAELAKLFATMQAREAARVLEHMEDQEVQVILGQLGNRDAAAILSNLTPERAAVISRTILRGERSAQ